MAKTAWLATPIAIVVLHRLASTGGATSATTTLLLLAAATFAALIGVGLVLRRLGVRSPALGIVIAALFWLSVPTLEWPDWIGEAGIEAGPITLGPATQQRDLIVVLIDDYPTSQALLVDHGYDNAEFQLELSDRGFDVVPEAWSNSSHPLLAIAAALSGHYPGPARNERDSRQLTAVLEGDNPMAELLRDNGYATTHLGAPSTAAIWFGGPDRSGTATFDELAEAIDAATGNETPDFVFAYINRCDWSEAGTASAADDVIANATCNNRLLVWALDRTDDGAGRYGETPTASAAGPIVVIAGTRGAAIDDDLGDSPDAWPRSAIVRGLGVFSAIRLAPDCQPPRNDATVSIIVHHAVACALGVHPDPLPDRAVVIKGDLVDPDGRLEVNLNVLRSDLSGQNLRKSH